jgi:hypothetical protein
MAVVHADCYTLFKAECQTEDRDRRLWAAIKAREPWDRALRLQVSDCRFFLPQSTCIVDRVFGEQSCLILKECNNTQSGCDFIRGSRY